MMAAMASPVIDPLELTKTLVAEIKGKNSGLWGGWKITQTIDLAITSKKKETLVYISNQDVKIKKLTRLNLETIDDGQHLNK